jgi:transcriptional regulator with XRE-family HTH domain
MNLGTKIKIERENKRYSQEFMAAQLNTTQATISRIESGFTYPSLKKLLAIAKILELSLQDFSEAL